MRQQDEEDFMELNFDLVEKETDKAYLLNFDDKQEWIPKSQAQIMMDPHNGMPGCVRMPLWLAFAKGLEDYDRN